MSSVLSIVKARVALEASAPIPKLVPYPKPRYDVVDWSNVVRAHPEVKDTARFETQLDSYFVEMIELGVEHGIIERFRGAPAIITSLDSTVDIMRFLRKYSEGEFNLYAVHLRSSILHSNIFFAKPNFERELFSRDEWKDKFERIVKMHVFDTID